VKEKLMNRTQLVTDAIKSDEPLVSLPINVASQRGKSHLNKTGAIILKTGEELLD
jgi:hypothetical protein